MDLIVTCQMPIPFSYLDYRDVVLEYAQHVAHMFPAELAFNVIDNKCYGCHKVGHIKHDFSSIKRAPAICFRCGAAACRVCLVTLSQSHCALYSLHTKRIKTRKQAVLLVRVYVSLQDHGTKFTLPKRISPPPNFLLYLCRCFR